MFVSNTFCLKNENKDIVLIMYNLYLQLILHVFYIIEGFWIWHDMIFFVLLNYFSFLLEFFFEIELWWSLRWEYNFRTLHFISRFGRTKITSTLNGSNAWKRKRLKVCKHEVKLPWIMHLRGKCCSILYKKW